MDRSKYPDNWDEIALGIKELKKWRCEVCKKQCRRPGEPFDTHKRTATVMHLNHTESDCRPENLKCACAPCHLKYDVKHHAETRYKKKYKNQLKLFKEEKI